MSCGCCLEACPQYLKIELERHDGETDAALRRSARTRRTTAASSAPTPSARRCSSTRNPTGQNNAGERLDALMAEGGIQVCGNAQNCVAVCPKKIPLTTSHRPRRPGHDGADAQEVVRGVELPSMQRRNFRTPQATRARILDDLPADDSPAQLTAIEVLTQTIGREIFANLDAYAAAGLAAAVVGRPAAGLVDARRSSSRCSSFASSMCCRCSRSAEAVTGPSARISRQRPRPAAGGGPRGPGRRPADAVHAGRRGPRGPAQRDRLCPAVHRRRERPAGAGGRQARARAAARLHARHPGRSGHQRARSRAAFPGVSRPARSDRAGGAIAGRTIR